LTAAAYDILFVLGKTAKLVDLGFKDVELYVKKGHEKEYLTIVNKAQNFFKHANKDPKATIEFNPELNTHLLLSAVKLYKDLTKGMPNNMTVYALWFGLMYPNLIKEEHRKEHKYRWKQLNPVDKSKFLDLIHALDKSR